eukprot:12893625-Prorocentrum_lima.AAC.1
MAALVSVCPHGMPPAALQPGCCCGLPVVVRAALPSVVVTPGPTLPVGPPRNCGKWASGATGQPQRPGAQTKRVEPK